MPDSLDRRLGTIARQPFRARFHRRDRELVKAQLDGPARRATALNVGGRGDPIYYVVVHDPEGNEFCVS